MKLLYSTGDRPPTLIDAERPLLADLSPGSLQSEVLGSLLSSEPLNEFISARHPSSIEHSLIDRVKANDLRIRVLQDELEALIRRPYGIEYSLVDRSRFDDRLKINDSRIKELQAELDETREETAAIVEAIHRHPSHRFQLEDEDILFSGALRSNVELHRSMDQEESPEHWPGD